MSENHSTKYGCLTVLSKRGEGGRTLCFCRCDCGTEREFREDRIKAGRIKSCGCKRSRVGRTHGYCRGDGAKSRVYRVWASMLSRCNDQNSKSYPSYGGRGIVTCERWQGPNGFPTFLADMGEPPDGTSIDRIDNAGNYEPGNCRWATRKEQQRNTRRNRNVTCWGRTQSVAAWAEEMGLEHQTICERLKRGWTPERTLTTPSLKPQMKNLKRYGG